ncbi:MAG TPA: hypothetical protein VMF91_04190 [Bryobacteraceae bacterium]|nr:hypothetical protein [Bryobacteraceae bacterium]
MVAAKFVMNYFGVASSIRKSSAVAALVCLCLLSCAGRNRGSAKIEDLDVTPTDQPGVFQVQARMRGRLDGLTYKWAMDFGSCTPATTPHGSSTCEINKSYKSDRIVLVVERDAFELDRFPKSVPPEIYEALHNEPPDQAQSDLPPQVHRSSVPRQSKNVFERLVPLGPSVQITTIPRFDEAGGGLTHADIAGRVAGIEDTTNYRVVLYAKTDKWYIQPLIGSLTSIAPDGTWRTWTHTGAYYVAFVVDARCDPSPQLAFLQDFECKKITSTSEVRGK